MKTLLVIVPDRLSSLIVKGEITARYYNPGDLFDEVHILATNNDRPDIAALQKTAGHAKLYLHNLPFTLKDFVLSFGLNPILLKKWADGGVKLARQIQPAMVRTHGDNLNAFVAHQIKTRLGIPYLVSLHTNADENPYRSTKQKIFDALYEGSRQKALRGASRVLPVYQSIIPYLQKRGVSNFEVVYNTLNSQSISPKKKYLLHKPVRLISVGRHYELKNPENIIAAIKRIPTVTLTLVGHGPYQEHLESLVATLKLGTRVRFLPSIANDQLCKMLPAFDIFVVHTQAWEFSKAVLEALLTGLPIILNKRDGKPVPELEDAPVLMAENTAKAYGQAINSLIGNGKLRSQMGRRAREYAMTRWDPRKTEAHYVNIYREVLREGVRSRG